VPVLDGIQHCNQLHRRLFFVSNVSHFIIFNYEHNTMVRRAAGPIYKRETLRQFHLFKVGSQGLIPAKLRKLYCGCRADKVKRLHFKPVLPSIILGNVNSLKNKFDELVALLKNIRTYECSLMCFMTWLNGKIPNSCVDLTSFTMLRAVWDCTACGKKKGGGC